MRNPDTSHLILEACVETLEQCILAEKNGANRLELCADLSVGGLTPSRELLDSVMAAVKIPVMAMIRPRAGNFVCSAEEIEEMKRSILLCKTAGVAGVVFGCLTPDSRIDVAQTSELVRFALPLSVTFHKAIDETSDPVAATSPLKQIPGIQRILTSGGAATALEGQEVLRKMIEAAGEGLTILAAGKVTSENLADVHQAVGAKEYHGKRIVF